MAGPLCFGKPCLALLLQGEDAEALSTISDSEEGEEDTAAAQRVRLITPNLSSRGGAGQASLVTTPGSAFHQR